MKMHTSKINITAFIGQNIYEQNLYSIMKYFKKLFSFFSDTIFVTEILHIHKWFVPETISSSKIQD
jgi:hypothetical protein